MTLDLHVILKYTDWFIYSSFTEYVFQGEFLKVNPCPQVCHILSDDDDDNTLFYTIF